MIFAKYSLPRISQFKWLHQGQMIGLSSQLQILKRENVIALFFFFPQSIVDLQYCVRFWSIVNHYRLVLGIEYSSLCYIVHPCWLSIVCIVVCVCQFHAPNLSLPTSLSPLVTVSLFSMSVSLFLFCIHLHYFLDSIYK